MGLSTEVDLDYDEDDQDTLADRYLTFSIEGEEYGIPIAFVVEIVGVQHITPVPDMPGHVKGVINLRGRVIPVVDIRLRFRMEERPYDDRTCVVIVDIDGTVVGLVVDTVSEVAFIPEDEVSDPPKVRRKASTQFIQGLGKREENVTIILSLERILYDDELAQLADMSAESADQD